MTAMTRKKVMRARTMMPARYPSTSPLSLRTEGLPPVGAGVADAMAMAAARSRIMGRRKKLVFMAETMGWVSCTTKGASMAVGPATAASYVPLMTPCVMPVVMG
jgi:hypothetical protein